MYVICVSVCVHYYFFCMSLCMFVFNLLFPSNVNSIVYTLMYVPMFGYIVNKLEIW